MPSQKEIAGKCGVSQTAVSLVLSGSPIRIAPEKRRAILKLAGARSASRKTLAARTGTLCTLLDARAESGDPYYQRFLTGIQEELARRGQQLLLHAPAGRLPMAVMEKCDGFIVQDKSLAPPALEALSLKRPLVLLNRDEAGFDAVMPDNEGGIGQAVSHLAGSGRDDIAFFSLQSLGLHGEQRLAAYRKHLAQHGLSVREDRIFLPVARERTHEEVVRFAHEFLRDHRPSKGRGAVLTGDQYGLALLRACAERGVRVPEDLAVVGYDNTLAGRYASPALSTVEQPMEAMGREAVRLLLDRTAGSGAPPRKLMLPVELIIRSSSEKK